MLSVIMSERILGNFFYLSASFIDPSKKIPPIVCVINLLNEKKKFVLIMIPQMSKYTLTPFIKHVYQGADLSQSIVTQTKKYITYLGSSPSNKHLGHQELYDNPVWAVKVEWGNPPRGQCGGVLCV